MLRILFAFGWMLLFIASAPAYALGHWQGAQRALVLLLEWQKAPAVHDREFVERTFFGESNVSLRDFFKENSAGSFDLTGGVTDWVTSSKVWDSRQGCTLEPIITEAWRLNEKTFDIADYDSDGNGRIDNLFVVHTGRIPHDRVGPECTFAEFSGADHAIVFQERGLGSVGEAIPIGFYIHEAGHGYFHLPDLYRDHYRGKYGIGMWGMMGLGAWGVSNQTRYEDLFRLPAHFEPKSKIVIGWIRPRIFKSSARRVTLQPVETSGDIIKIPISNGDHYYLEYRSRRGFSEGLPGHGLLIWRGFDLIQADGRDDLNNGNSLGRRPLPPIDENFGDDSDPFPGSLAVTRFEDKARGLVLENIRWHQGDKGQREGDYIQLDIVTLANYESGDGYERELPIYKAKRPL